MRLLLGDAHITLPEDVLATLGQSSRRAQRYRISGAAMDEARSRVIDAAIGVGYELFCRPGVMTLVRGERRIVVTEVAAHELLVTAYSTTRFPAAMPDLSGIALGRLWIEVPVEELVIAIPPKEARTSGGGTEWKGQWEISGLDASAILRGVLDSLTAHGLDCTGPYALPDAVRGGRWSARATGPNTLVKVYVTREDERVLLDMVLLDHEPEPVSEPGSGSGAGRESESEP